MLCVGPAILDPANDDDGTFRLCGAGVLPFRVSRDGTVVFLLGQEAYAQGWSGSGKLSAFEGGNEGGETAVRNAVREFAEESLGVLCDRLGETRALEEALSGGDFAMRVCVRDSRRKEEHCTYVKRFAWDEDVVRKFATRREVLTCIDGLGSKMRALEPTLPHGYPFLLPDDAVCVHGAPYRVEHVEARLNATADVLLVEARLVREAEKEEGGGEGEGEGGGEEWGEECGDEEEGRGGEEEELQRRTTPGAERQRRRYSYGPLDEGCRAYAQYLSLRSELTSRIGMVPQEIHRALNLTTSSKGTLRGAAVRKEWIEKACVHEYTLAQLVRAVQSNRQVFRPYFVLVVRQVIAQFLHPPKPHAVLEGGRGRPLSPPSERGRAPIRMWQPSPFCDPCDEGEQEKEEGGKLREEEGGGAPPPITPLARACSRSLPS